MSDRLKKLLDLLSITDTENYRGTINEMTVNEADHCWFFDITFDEVLSIKEFTEFAEKMEVLPSKVPSIKTCEFKITYHNAAYQELPDYYDFVLKKLAAKKPRFNAIIDFQIEQDENRLELLCPSDATFVADMLEEIKDALENLGMKCILATKVCHKQPSINDSITKASDDFMDSIKQNMQEETPTIHFVSFDEMGNFILPRVDEFGHKTGDVSEPDLLPRRLCQVECRQTAGRTGVRHQQCPAAGDQAGGAFAAGHLALARRVGL